MEPTNDQPPEAASPLMGSPAEATAIVQERDPNLAASVSQELASATPPVPSRDNGQEQPSLSPVTGMQTAVISYWPNGSWRYRVQKARGKVSTHKTFDAALKELRSILNVPNAES